MSVKNGCLYIFDLDDTLVNTHQKAFEKTVRTAFYFGYDLDYERFCKAYGKMDFFSCLNYWFGDLDVSEFREFYNSIRLDYPYFSIGNIKKLFEDLSIDNSLGIITNSSRDGTFFKLECLRQDGVDLEKLDFVFHGDNMVSPKPSPEQLKMIFCLGYQRKKTVYIGDNVRDFEFSLNGGIDFYAVLSGLETKEDFISRGLGEDRILNTVHDLLDF